jgi:alpha-tubulin suppressor-like RCC1 family protein
MRGSTRSKDSGLALRLAATAIGVMLLIVTPAVLGNPPSEPSPGQLWAFGNNNAAQLGNETNVESQEPNPPTPVALPQEAGPVVGATAGGTHTLVMTESGQAYAFGYNYHGQLGNSTYIEGNGPHGWNPTPALIVLPGQDGPVIQVAGGGESSFVLTESGQLYAFGNNTFGQLGNETNINQITGKANPTPTLVTLPGQNGPVVEVAPGLQHTLVLTESGQLYSFGANTSGQLGRETTPEPGKWANPTPTLVTLPGQIGPVVKIAAGRESSLALTEGGQLYSFGNNRFGQLGYEENSGPGPDPFENNHQTPTLVTMPEAVGEVIDIAAGSFHTLALTDEGQLYAFGKNTFGELGNSTNNENQEANPTPTAVDLPSAAGQIDEIAAGYEDSFVLTSTGRLYSFGWNWFAELGRTTNNKSLKPNPIPTVAAMPAGAALEAVGTGPTASHTLAVVGMAMTTSSLPAGSEGSPYDAQLVAEGGVSPYRWSAKGLPAGLSVDQGSGELSGVPTGVTCSQAQCEYSPTFTVTDSGGMEVSRALTLALAPEPSTSPGDDPGGDGTPPDSPPQPPVEEDVTQARLRIGRVHPTASGTKLVVGGTIVKRAAGDVAVKAIAHLRGRRITVSRMARIHDGHWRVRFPLSSAPRLSGAIQLSVRFKGSPGVEGANARRRVNLV